MSVAFPAPISRPEAFPRSPAALAGEPIIPLHEKYSMRVYALNSFYALFAYGLHCHRTKKEDRLPPERIEEIINALKKDPKFPTTVGELNALIYRSTKTKKGLCHEFDQVVLNDGEGFPFKVKFTSTTVDIRGLEGDFGLNVPHRVISAYQACKDKLDAHNVFPLPCGLPTLRRIHLIYSYKYFGGPEYIFRKPSEIHEILEDLKNHPGFMPFPEAGKEGTSLFELEMQASGRNCSISREGRLNDSIFYDYVSTTPLKFGVGEDGHLIMDSDEAVQDALEIFEAYEKPKKQVLQEYPLGKATLSFLNALDACYILAYFIRYKKEFIPYGIRSVPEELPKMITAIQRDPSLDYNSYIPGAKNDRVKSIYRSQDFLNAFTKEAVFKEGAWFIKSIGTIELNLRIKDNVLYTDEFDKKYGYGSGFDALKAYETIANKLDFDNDSPIPKIME